MLRNTVPVPSVNGQLNGDFTLILAMHFFHSSTYVYTMLVKGQRS